MSQTKSTRREFFRTVLRYGTLGALAGLGVLAAFRRHGKSAGAYPCGLSGPCAGCASASNCTVKPAEGGTLDG